MTPDERAARIVDRGRLKEDLRMDRAWADVLRLEIADALRAAVAEEREACAQVAESFGTRSCDDAPGTVKAIAAAILARGDPPPGGLTACVELLRPRAGDLIVVHYPSGAAETVRPAFLTLARLMPDVRFLMAPGTISLRHLTDAQLRAAGLARVPPPDSPPEVTR